MILGGMVKKGIVGILLMCSAVRLLPHCVLLMLSSQRTLIEADLHRWESILFGKGQTTGLARLVMFVRLMTFFKEYRNVFYYRVGVVGRIFWPLCPPMSTLFIHARRIGPGLFIQHGLATIIAANEIGKNCWINQQVSIGYSNATDCPTVGDNVTISAGAKVIGAVSLGDNCKVGANAVVVKNVPANTTVVGVPAYIVRMNGIKVRLPL
jgi:serine O-acetyltransferase